MESGKTRKENFKGQKQWFSYHRVQLCRYAFAC
jgi:hypothetical protein